MSTVITFRSTGSSEAALTLIRTSVSLINEGTSTSCRVTPCRQTVQSLETIKGKFRKINN